MSEMTQDNQEEYDLQRLLTLGNNPVDSGKVDIEEALRTADPEQAMQYIQMLNPDQQNLLPGGMENPESFGEGLRNIGTNLKTRLAERIGFNPSYERRIQQQRLVGMGVDQRIDIEENQRKREATNRAINLRTLAEQNTTIDPKVLQNFSDATINEIMSSLQGDLEYIDGVGFGQKNINTNQLTIVGKSSDQLIAYDNYVKTIEEKNKKVEGRNAKVDSPYLTEELFQIPSFEDYKREEEIRTNYPSAVKEFEYWKTLNPKLVDEMSPAKLAEMFRTYTANPGVGYIQEAAEAKRMGEQGGLSLTVAQQEVDKNYAPIYNEFVNLGVAAEFRRDIGEINNITKQLLRNDPKDELSGRLVALLDDGLRTDASLNVEQSIGRIVVKSLRATMGTQFTDEEGKRFISYAYNVRLDPRMNASRIARLRNALEEGFNLKKAKNDYYQKNGTLKGFKGLAPNKFDIYDATFRVDDYKGMTDEDLLTELRRVGDDDLGLDAEFEVLMKAVQQRKILK